VLQRGWIGGVPKRVTGVLDIGTSKVACLIAAVDADPRVLDERGAPVVRILGVGHQRSLGVKGGVITDLDQAEQAARSAIAQAERMAGVMLEEVHVSVACGRLKSHNFTASADIESGVVTDADFNRLLAGGQQYVERAGRTLVHLNEVAVRLDGATGVRDPRGMAAAKISADLHAVSADEAPLRNLLLVVERCYMAVASLTPAPFASALAVTSAEERRLGVTSIDIGGGTATLAMFADGRFLHAAAIPMGGNQITVDIARALHTPLAEAERIKALYGTLVSAQSDEHEVFSYPPTGGDEGTVQHMTRAELAEVVRPRVGAIVAQIRELIEGCEVARYTGRCVVLTGGGSQLVGIADYVANELSLPVRVATPQAISGLPPVVSSAAFSTAAGLLLAATPDQAGRITFKDRDPAPHGYLHRVGSWLRDGF
jgi:cell division protein FtsA